MPRRTPLALIIATSLLLPVFAAPVMAQGDASRTATAKRRSFNRLPSRFAGNGKIAFQCRVGDLPFICTVNADGTNLRQIAEGAQPVWSPDGNRLAFTRSSGSTVELYVVGADGSDLRLIADGSAPDWSPDSLRLTFTRLIGSRTETFLVNADGSNPQPISDGGFAWSHDGKRLAFKFSDDIFTANSDLTNLRIIARDIDENTSILGWLPDDEHVTLLRTYPSGERIIFSADVTGNLSFDSNGSLKPLVLIAREHQINQPALSPDGTKLAFTSGGSEGLEIYVTDLSAGTTHRITRGRRDDFLPQWSPDGKRLLFHSAVDLDNFDIFAVNPDGSNLVRLTATRNLTEEMSPAWSPDGGKVVYFRREGKTDPTLIAAAGLYVSDADGANPLQIAFASQATYPGLLQIGVAWQPQPKPRRRAVVFANAAKVERHREDKLFAVSSGVSAD